MKKIIALLFIACMFAQFSCDPDPVFEGTTNVELVFKGKYADETFFVNKDYTYNGDPIRFDQFNFYIGNVVLVKEIVGNPEETELLEVDFVDLSYKPVDAADAERGFVVTASNIPVGDYSGIKINFGVPADLNKTNWSDYGSGHPLRQSGHYWPAWESFIFSKTEARIDVDGNGSFAHKISYHTGADEAYRTRFFAKDIQLKEDVTTQVSFEVDAIKMFENIDVMQENGTHSVTHMDLINKVMDNLEEEAISIE
ncbi:MAG: MbnP family protein [Bacteroidota bacterium]